MTTLDTLTARALIPILIDFVRYGDIHEAPLGLSGLNSTEDGEAITRCSIADTFAALLSDDPQIRRHAEAQIFNRVIT